MPLEAMDSNEINVKYDIDYSSEIGRGRNSIIRKCTELETGKHYALESAPQSEMDIVEDMKAEAALLSKLDHANIIKLHDTYQDKDHFYMVTELCNGVELYDRVTAKTKGKEKQYSEREVAKIIRQLVEAVASCHDKQIVHRDLKITNIMMKDNTSNCTDIKLIDFGFATEHDEKNGAPPMIERVGTTCYMAPEVLENSYNRSCDIWAIGVITYILFSGKPPFVGTDHKQTCEMIRSPYVQARFPFMDWHDTSDTAIDFIKSLLQKDPSLRPSITDLKNHPWLRESAVTTVKKGSTFLFLKKFKKALKVKSPSFRGLHFRGVPNYGLKMLQYS